MSAPAPDSGGSGASPLPRLPTAHYGRALEALRAVPINTSAAEVVLRGQAEGVVYADDAARPAVYLVVHPSGMSYLFGDGAAAGFDDRLRDYLANRGGFRRTLEVLQVFPERWAARIPELMGGRIVPGRELQPEGFDYATIKAAAAGRIVEWVRLNFAFDAARYRAAPPRALAPELQVRRIGAEGYGFEGTTVPRHFWPSAEAFGRHGVAYGVVRGADLLSLAFGAMMLDDRVEIGIETRADHRGAGLARQACGAMIEHCLAARIEPLWSCRQGNAGSEATARSLGFVETRQLPYYQLVE